MAQLLNIPASEPLEIRDKAILELFYSSGLRLSELTGLDWDALDLAGGTVRVLDKGRKTRQVPVGTQARDALKHWQSIWPAWASHESARLGSISTPDPSKPSHTASHISWPPFSHQVREVNSKSIASLTMTLNQ